MLWVLFVSLALESYARQATQKLEKPSDGRTQSAATVLIPDGGFVTNVLIEPSNPERLYAGLLYSWPRVLDFSRPPVWLPSVPPLSLPGTRLIYAADDSFSDLYAWMAADGTGDPAIFHSTDHGTSWAPVPPPPNVSELNGFATDSSPQPTMFWASEFYLYSSSDNGNTWQALTAAPTGDGFLLVTNTKPATVYTDGLAADGSYGLFKSTDLGSTWTFLPNVPENMDYTTLVADPTDPLTIYAGGYEALFKSRDGGTSWTEYTKGIPSPPGQPILGTGTIAVDPKNSSIVFAGFFTYPDAAEACQYGLLKSSDGGQTWESTGFCPPSGITSITVDPADDNVLYLGTDQDGVLRSHDAGLTFIPFDAGLANALVGTMSHPRFAGHTATLLDDGTVLVAGGNAVGCCQGPIRWCDRYTPTTGLFTPTGSMTIARAYQTATRLQDGRILVAGGNIIPISCMAAPCMPPITNSAEIYDPATGQWSTTGSMTHPRSQATADFLPNGNVFIIGGEIDGPSAGELFDPSTGTFSVASPLPIEANVSTSTLLNDGTVLVTANNPTNASVYYAFLYDYLSDSWIQVDSPLGSTYQDFASRLHDGRVLFVGNGVPQVFDPATRSFSYTSSLPLLRDYFVIPSLSEAITLDDGRVYIAGGSYSAESFPLAEIYDPEKGTFEAAPDLAVHREMSVSVKLQNGNVLIVGGGTDYIFEAPEVQAEVFIPKLGISVVVPSGPTRVVGRQ